MRCLNWKVIAALAAVGIGLYVLAPGLAGAALPLLVVAACPLSMLLMMRAMGSMGSCKPEDDTTSANADELAQLRAEVAALRAERKSPSEATR
jgi:L-asparagine transporter-like permease